jgi:hypothetical protein
VFGKHSLLLITARRGDDGDVVPLVQLLDAGLEVPDPGRDAMAPGSQVPARDDVVREVAHLLHPRPDVSLRPAASGWAEEATLRKDRIISNSLRMKSTSLGTPRRRATSSATAVRVLLTTPSSTDLAKLTAVTSISLSPTLCCVCLHQWTKRAAGRFVFVCLY